MKVRRLFLIAILGVLSCDSSGQGVGELEDMATVNPIPFRTQTASSANAEYLVRMEPYPGRLHYYPDAGPPLVYVFRWTGEAYEIDYTLSIDAPQRLVFAADNGNFVTIGWLSLQRQTEVVSVYSSDGIVGILGGDTHTYSEPGALPEQDVAYWVDWTAPIEWDGGSLYLVSKEHGPMLVNPADASWQRP